ncbi:MAG: YibE/F family protein, partial [Mycobacterium sp.]|nr:YibE/F family protein [Mycobacterium sp.]
MAHSHSHTGPAPLSPLAARIVIAALTAIGIATMIGAALLWPGGSKVDIPLPFQNGAGGLVTTEGGHVLSSATADCGSASAGKVLTGGPAAGVPGSGTCVQSMITIDTGPNAGANTLLEFSPGPGQPKLMAGDHIRIFRQVDQQGATGYGFYDFERTWPLAMLAALFAVVIVAIARWRGLRALVGIVIAFGVLVIFMLPALRDGAPAL